MLIILLLFIFVSSQTIHSPEDVSVNCVDYPNMFFETYADCDDDFVRRSLPENLKPFWSVSNISSATNHYTPASNESFSMLLAKMSESIDLCIEFKYEPNNFQMVCGLAPPYLTVPRPALSQKPE